MNILVVCDQNNNRSVTLAGQLKYLGHGDGLPGHEVLTAGISVTGTSTFYMLGQWADKVIAVDREIYDLLSHGSLIDVAKLELWDIGPDNYPRPYNKELLKICRRLIAEHPEIR